jgi:hypothetical protein
MAERMREVVGKHSTWYVCDEHGWDFTNVDEDVCPVCYGESLAEQRIIKLLEDIISKYGLSDGGYTQGLIELIKGEK